MVASFGMRLAVLAHSSMKRYKLYPSTFALVFYEAWPALMDIFFIAVFLTHGKLSPWSWVILGGFVLITYRQWRSPFEIRVNQDQSIEFRSLVGNTATTAARIKSVKIRRSVYGVVNVEHAKGTLRLINRIDGFDKTDLREFLMTVKRMNPAIEIAPFLLEV